MSALGRLGVADALAKFTAGQPKVKASARAVPADA
jgi:hypothetical protein